jgi:hypothetical protein
VPEKVLHQILASKGSLSVRQALIKWTALLESSSTSEDPEILKQRFPVAPAWGQAVPKEGGGGLLLLMLCLIIVMIQRRRSWASARTGEGSDPTFVSSAQNGVAR